MRIDLRRAGSTRSASMCTCHGGTLVHMWQRSGPIGRPSAGASGKQPAQCSGLCCAHALWQALCKRVKACERFQCCASFIVQPPHTMEHVSARTEEAQAVAVLLLRLERPLGGAHGQTQMKGYPCKVARGSHAV